MLFEIFLIIGITICPICIIPLLVGLVFNNDYIFKIGIYIFVVGLFFIIIAIVFAKYVPICIIQ